jgi:hypothetical protein
MPDRVFAGQLRCPAYSVTHKRKILAIPACSSGCRRWTPVDIEMLGQLKDKQVAR